MQQADSIIHSGRVVTVNDRFDVLENHALVIDQGKILAILPSNSRDLEAFNAKETYRLDHHVLMPGLISAHGHAPSTLIRGWAEDTLLMPWLEKYIWPIEAEVVNPAFVADGSRLAIAEMLTRGITCYSDMYIFAEAAAQTATEMGIKQQLTTPVFDTPSSWGSGAGDYLNKAETLINQYMDSPLINPAIGPNAPFTVSDAAFSNIRQLSNIYGANVQTHLHETEEEVEQALAETGQRPIARLHALGLLNNRFQAVHMTALNDTDIAMFADARAHVIHCPQSNMKLVTGCAPVKKLLDAGVNVALGCDGSASNNDLDMFGEMHTAALLAKITANDAAAISAEQAIAMATINGAKAMGIDDQTGSLEPGKCADIIALDLSGVAHQPIYNIATHLVYTNVGNTVTHSWVNGEMRLDNGQLVDVDVEAIRHTTRAWQEKIEAFSATR